MDTNQREVKTLKSTLSFELELTACMVSELALSMSMIDDASQLQLGIESLSCTVN